MEETNAPILNKHQEIILAANEFSFQDYLLNFEIGRYSKVGIFARQDTTIHEFLLTLSGIIRSKGLFYQGVSCYDAPKYFANRIYADTSLSYFSTLSTKTIALKIYQEFHKEVDEERLNRLVRSLYLRRECVVRDEVEFTPMGKTMMLLATLLCIQNSLIIRNPLQDLNQEMSNYFVSELVKKEEALFIGGGSLKPWQGRLDALLILGDNGMATLMDPTIQALYLATGPVIFSDKTYFICEQHNKHIILDINKGSKVVFDRKHPKAIQINPYELEKYLI
ncbi:MAG: hypothetical protein WC182_02575 [Bacilli bacterium]